MIRFILAAVLTLASVHAAFAAGKMCDVRTFGARGDGSTKDTVAIQRAIDSCAAGKGGGTVQLSDGTFVSAPILLKSGVTLDIGKGAVLLGSPDHGDYPRKTEFRAPGYQALVSAVNAEHIAITGGGIIDGAGESWWKLARTQKDAGVLGSENSRPRLVVFDHCRHVRMEDITVQNSPMWQIVPYYTDDVIIRNVRILADPHSPNTDAIDPFSSTHVVIDHVYADVGDDNIAIKSGMINSPGPDSPSADITITDCEFHHGHGLSIGSEIAGGAQGIRAERIHFVGTDNGVRIKANRDRGNNVSDIHFKDITMEGVKTAILISEYYPKALPEGAVESAPVTRLTPHFHNILIENLSAKQSAWAGVIIGLPEAPATDISFRNVSIEAKRGMVIAYAQVTTQNFHVTGQTGSDAIFAMPSATLTYK